MRSLLESCDHPHEARVLKDALYPLDRSFVLNSCYQLSYLVSLQLCLPSELTKRYQDPRLRRGKSFVS